MMKTPTKKPKRTIAESVQAIEKRTVRLPKSAPAKGAAQKSAGKSAPVVKLPAPKKSPAKNASPSARETRTKFSGVYYNCPVTGDGHFDVDFRKRKGLVVRRTRTSAVLSFPCARCEDRHTIEIPFNSTARS